MLQWGRAHVSAESCGIGFHAASSSIASMGPRSRERGKPLEKLSFTEANGGLQWGRAHVSAESTLIRWPGNRSRAGLQWGRAHVSAERAEREAGNDGIRELQWGRAHVSAERGECQTLAMNHRD